MDKKTNISTLDTSIFLKDGAFVRWQGTWYVFEGPFETAGNNNSLVFSVSCQDFYGRNRQILSASRVHTFESTDWLNDFKSEFHSSYRQWVPPSREFYSKGFTEIQAQIAAQNWKKAVPIALSKSLGEIQSAEKMLFLSKISKAPESLIPYGFWKDGIGMMGITPEILFWRKKNKLKTMALAGTEKKIGSKSTLLNDPKNLKEHDFVVRELFEKLSRVGKVKSYGPQILELPTLYHLITEFEAELQNDWNDLQELEYFHPTSALGISPFSKWKELEHLPEQKERNFLGSPLLFRLNEEESLALVALRQIQWNREGLILGAGGGVVQESQEELEWQEILAKIDSVKKLMGIS